MPWISRQALLLWTLSNNLLYQITGHTTEMSIWPTFFSRLYNQGFTSSGHPLYMQMWSIFNKSTGHIIIYQSHPVHFTLSVTTCEYKTLFLGCHQNILLTLSFFFIHICLLFFLYSFSIYQHMSICSLIHTSSAYGNTQTVHIHVHRCRLPRRFRYCSRLRFIDMCAQQMHGTEK